jgi:uncharacterized protein
MGERRLRTDRLIRQLHLWIGAWGAIAAILFGLTGFIQDHRELLELPQGDSIDAGTVEIPVPEAARATPALLRDWLRDVQHVDAGEPRVQPGRPVEFNGRKIQQPARWRFTAGNARTVLEAEYLTGDTSLALHTTIQSPLAVMTSLHKNEAGGIAWLLLEDSFGLALIVLGASGLLMWARGRSVRQMVFSIVGAAAIVLLLIGGHAVI